MGNVKDLLFQMAGACKMTLMFGDTKSVDSYSRSGRDIACASYARCGGGASIFPLPPAHPHPSAGLCDLIFSCARGRAPFLMLPPLPGAWLSVLRTGIVWTFPNEQVVRIKTKQETNEQFQRERETEREMVLVGMGL